ncbi:MAG: HAD-IIA family hydrolase [Propioniciclava sp.]
MTAFIDSYDVALFDLDGVLYLGPAAVEDAVAGVGRLSTQGIRPFYVTNNAARSTAVVAAHLVDLGFPAHELDVISSAQATVGMLAQELPVGASILVAGSGNLVQLIEDAGFRAVFSADDNPVAVVQGYDPAMTWPRLDEAGLAVQRGARWIATNTDSTRPTERGRVPGAGMMVAAVQATVDIEPEIIGKPHRPLMAEAMRRTGAINPVFVGDRIDTDIMGAHTVGIDSFMVFTGAHGVLDLCRAPVHGRPTAIGWNVASLFEPTRTAEPAADGVRCGATVVTASNGVAAVEGDLSSRTAQLDAAWALATLCWTGVVSQPEPVAQLLRELP